MDNKGKNVRVALCDNHWWQAELKRGYLYGQDSIEDRPPRTPRPTRTHGTLMAESCSRKGSVTRRYTACFPAQAAPTTTTVATISRAGRTSKSPVPLATS